MTTKTKSRMIDGLTVNIKDFAVIDGGESTTGFQQAIDALPTSGGVILVDGDNYNVTIANLDYKGKNIVWRGGAKINGEVKRKLNGYNEIFTAAIGRTIYYQYDGGDTRRVSYEYEREANYTGGPGGNPDSIIKAITNIGPNVGSSGNRKAEWSIQALVNNDSTWSNGVALTGQAIRNSDGAVWSGQFNSKDTTATNTHATRSIETSIQALGNDTNELRWVLNVIAHNQNLSYTGNDSVYVGTRIESGSADYEMGLQVVESGASKVRQRAIDVVVSNDIMHGICKTGPSVVKLGSTNSSGNIATALSVGKNSSGATVNYSNMITSIGSSSAGSETGVIRFNHLNSGSEVTSLEVGGGLNSVAIRVNGSLKFVKQGDADSGGAGFRMLRVDN